MNLSSNRLLVINYYGSLLTCGWRDLEYRHAACELKHIGIEEFMHLTFNCINTSGSQTLAETAEARGITATRK
jgi:hypothetical protein